MAYLLGKTRVCAHFKSPMWCKVRKVKALRLGVEPSNILHYQLLISMVRSLMKAESM
jgi:hypothetical protein